LGIVKRFLTKQICTFIKKNTGMKKSLLFIMSIAIVIVVITACSKGSGNSESVPVPSTCTAESAKFSTDVNPIIQSSCAIGSGCHGSGSTNGPGPLTNFEQIKNAASSIKSAVVSKLMPLVGSLSNAQIQSISCWVDNGALNN
jgi:hypothetical protein